MNSSGLGKYKQGWRYSLKIQTRHRRERGDTLENSAGSREHGGRTLSCLQPPTGMLTWSEPTASGRGSRPGRDECRWELGALAGSPRQADSMRVGPARQGATARNGAKAMPKAKNAFPRHLPSYRRRSCPSTSSASATGSIRYGFTAWSSQHGMEGSIRSSSK